MKRREKPSRHSGAQGFGFKLPDAVKVKGTGHIGEGQLAWEAWVVPPETAAFAVTS